jgi:hypothetical protein
VGLQFKSSKVSLSALLPSFHSAGAISDSVAGGDGLARGGGDDVTGEDGVRLGGLNRKKRLEID